MIRVRRYALLCCVMFLGCGSERGDVPAESVDRPNILFIAVDDLNDWVGFLGGHGGMDIHTPNLDRLAASSLVFTNAHTPSPACAPARIGVMTGVHPARSGIMRNTGYDGPGWRGREALAEVETLEQFFKNRGYATLGGGKIYHTLEPERTPRSQIEPESWDFYYPSAHINLPHQIRAPEEVINPDHFTEREFGGGKWWTWGPIPIPDEKMSDYHIVDWAAYELGRAREAPFFLAAGLFRPHSPWEVPEKYFDMYPLEEVARPEHRPDDLLDAADHGRRAIHEWVLENDQWARIVQAYAASISFADAMIGRLLEALEQSGRAEETIVVLWSDHGMHLGEKENYEKFTLWETATRVPLLVRIPGHAEAGRRIDRPVSLLDIYPTLAEAAGFEAPAHVDGESLLAHLEDGEARRGPVVTSYRVGGDVGVGHAVRSEHYRYIYYPEIGLEELYDHRSDPNEWTNAAYRPQRGAVVEEHRQVLRELLPELRWREGEPTGYTVEDGAVRKDNFRSLSE